MTPTTIRAMRHDDLGAVLALQHQCYVPAFHEPLAAFASKLTAAPDSCWVAQDEQARVCAYLVCVPVEGPALPALHAPDHRPARAPDWLYLHDMAIAPFARGLGLAPRLLAHALTYAREAGLARVGLIAVQDSCGFWQKQGFEADRGSPSVPPDKLATFGPDAVFMQNSVAD